MNIVVSHATRLLGIIYLGRWLLPTVHECAEIVATETTNHGVEVKRRATSSSCQSHLFVDLVHYLLGFTGRTSLEVVPLGLI